MACTSSGGELVPARPGPASRRPAGTPRRRRRRPPRRTRRTAASSPGRPRGDPSRSPGRSPSCAPARSTRRLPAHRSPCSSAGGSGGPHSSSARGGRLLDAGRGAAGSTRPRLDGPAGQWPQPPLDEELGPVVGRREVDGLRAEVAGRRVVEAAEVRTGDAVQRGQLDPEVGARSLAVRPPTSIHSSTRPDGRSRTTSGTPTRRRSRRARQPGGLALEQAGHRRRVGLGEQRARRACPAGRPGRCRRRAPGVTAGRRARRPARRAASPITTAATCSTRSRQASSRRSNISA